MPVLPPKTLPKYQTRVDLTPNSYRKQILTKGLNVKWEMAAQCPCARNSLDVSQGFGFAAQTPIARTGESRTDCPLCQGRGYLYHSAQETKVLVTGRSETPERFRAYGESAKGMVSLSFLPENLPSFMDRLTLLDSVLVYREARVRGATATEALRYPVVIREIETGAGTKTMGTLYCHKASTTGVADSTGVLVEGTDYAITGDGKIDWALGIANGKAPAQNAQYAVTYFAHPRYIVVDHPFAIRDTWIKRKTPSPTYKPLPVRAMGKLEFLGDMVP